jgi:stearoyl-CoA desaturase (Delta-9 desaturase)
MILNPIEFQIIMQKEQRNHPNWRQEVGFVLIHLSPLLALWTQVTLFDWVLCIALYFVRMFFVTAGYHRYFSHKTFKTSRFFQFLLAFFAQTSLQKGALWWAANHRIHHQHSDTPKDPHSANVYGFWYSHIGWIMGPDYKKTRYEMIRDLEKFKELKFLNEFHLLPPLVLLIAVWLTGNVVNGEGIFDFAAGASTALIGFLLSTVLLYHGTFSINSLMHKWGKPRYNTSDKSKNSLVLALVTLGEGWHNNHHYYQSSTRQGFFWWEIDITYYIIKIWGWLGLVWDIREVPKEVKYNF